MSTVQEISNPFALMMDPESIFAAVARSERLARLTSRVCRPLDKLVIVPEPIVIDASLEENGVTAETRMMSVD
jgi:hypothetical protein